MSIKGYFLLFVAILTGAAVIAAATVMMLEHSELSDAGRTERMTRAFGATLQVQEHVSRERGHFNARLLGDSGGDDDEAALIARTDQAFDMAIDLLEADAIGHELADRMRQIHRDFLGFRRLAEEQVAAGRADVRVDRDYINGMVALMEPVDAVVDRAEQAATASAKPLARSYIEVARLAAIIRDYTGRRGSRMVRLLSAGGTVTPQLALTLGNDTGEVHATWQRLGQVVQVIGQIAAAEGELAPDDLRRAVEVMSRSYFQETEAAYSAVIEAGRTGVPSGITGLQLRALHVPAIATSVPIRDVALARALESAATDRRDAGTELTETAALLLLLLGTTGGAFLMLRRKVIAPLEALTRIVVRLAGNDRAVAVPELVRSDEIGQLARAIETLRVNAEHASAAERERQMMETQLRQAQKLESLGTLAGGIAHEINTPTQYVSDNIRFLETSFADIKSVLDRADALREAAEAEPALAPLARAQRAAETAADLDFLREEIPSAIAQSLDGVDRIRQIVLAVKEFSHPDVKEVVPLDLNRAIETTVTISRNQWKYVAALETALAEDLPPVPCRGGEINQVILNLIVNAAHAIEAKGAGMGKITVSTARRDGFAEIRVSDTGTGVPAEIRERIFDPFFTTKAPGKGTGQGLAICHAIVVQKHGGTIAVESTPGEGASFIVHLPLVAAQADALTVEAAA